MWQYEKAKKILEEYGQAHLLSNYEKIEARKKDKLIEQILGIDFEQINSLYQSTQSNEAKKEDAIEPITYVDKSELTYEELKRYEQIGIEEIKKGKLGVLTMAGGQRYKVRPYAGLKAHMCWDVILINHFLKFCVMILRGQKNYME